MRRFIIPIATAACIAFASQAQADDVPAGQEYIFIESLRFNANTSVPLPEEMQRYIWDKCVEATPDAENYYCFILGAIQHESSFKSNATHTNGNGSTDRGIMQINSCNIKKMKRAGLISSTNDLFDPYKCIDCGFYMMNQYIDKFGVTESAYYAYNTGKEREGSNKNSRIVMQYAAEWKSKLY